ncbi:hypothetical protein BH23BAC4_BH23BAC4_11810 [soil metagenome]
MTTMIKPLLRLTAFTLVAVAFSAAPVLAQASNYYVVRPGDTLGRIAAAQGLTVEQLMRYNNIEGDVLEPGQSIALRPGLPPPPAVFLPSAGAYEPVDFEGQRARRAGTYSLGPSEYQPEAPAPLAPSTMRYVPIRGGSYMTPLRFEEETEPAPTGGGPTRTHRVQSGETLFRIALNNNTTVDELRRLNNIQGDNISVGQELVVSGARRPATAQPTTPRPRPGSFDPRRSVVRADEVHFVQPRETLLTIAALYRITPDDILALNELTTAPLVPGTVLRLPTPLPSDSYRDPAAALLPPPDTTGMALVYSDSFVGRVMASGARYDPEVLSISHRTLPFGSIVLLTNPENGRKTFVVVRDRGPISAGYIAELSEATARVLDVDVRQAHRIQLRRIR